MKPIAYDEKQRLANEDARSHPGNDDRYDVSLVLADKGSPLFGKTIIFLGSSVTVGAFSLGQACPDFLAHACGALVYKEAVSGTALADDDHDGSSYIERMRTIPCDLHADAFVCQLSTNDAWKGKQMGAVVAEGPYDTATVAGAIQHVVQYARDTWRCPVAFYTGTYFESEAYAQMVELLEQVRDQMGIAIIDLYHDEGMRAVSSEDYALYMHDPVHPTKAGYQLWWTPKFEEVLARLVAPQMAGASAGENAMTEREKLDAGQWYDPGDGAELSARRKLSRSLYTAFNQADPNDRPEQRRILGELLGSYPDTATIMPNFACDYGWNIRMGEGSFINCNSYLMDCAPITIGRNVFIGPNCAMYTAIHPMLPAERNTALERAEAITVGDDCWLGGNVTICPGVTIGAGTVIGAGSVVTRDIPAGVVAVGNPCRVLRKLTDADRMLH